MTPRELEEYKALRATVRERGTARHWIVLVGLVSWAALALAGSSLLAAPVTTVVPLLVLVATFEVTFALHTGVERVGRYLQVFHETEAGTASWEHAAMTYGQSFKGGGIDALFTPLFWAAALLNLLPAAAVRPAAVEWAFLGVAHLLFVSRVWVARRHSAQQRAIDLQRFQQLKGAGAAPPPAHRAQS